jgi:tight adherence protein B
MSDGGIGLLVLAIALVIALAGVAQLLSAQSERNALASRSAISQGESRLEQLQGRLDARLRHSRFGSRLALRLTAAGVELGLLGFVLAAGGAALLGFVIARLVLPAWLALVVAAGCVRASWGWVARKQRQRNERFISQLPELARVLSNAASAGLAIRTALDMAAGELDEPAGTEMRFVAEELRIGQSIDGALENLGRRMPSRELGVLVTTIVIQHRTGGSLVTALRDMSDTLEARKDLRREVRTLMSGAVFTSYLVAAMGVGTVVLLNAITPGALHKMTSSFAGQVAFVVAASLYALGFFLIRRTTSIDT